MTTNPINSTSSVIWPDDSSDMVKFPFDASVPTNAVNPLQGTVQGYYEKLMNMIYWLHNNPANVKGGQVFIQYLINLSDAGKLDPNSTDPYVQKMLEQLNSPDIAALIRTTITLEGDVSWFQDGGNNTTVINDFLEPLIAATGGRPINPDAPDAGYANAIQRMINNILQGYESSLAAFSAAHKNSEGQLTWTQYGVTYTWNDQQSMILKILTGLTSQENEGFDANQFVGEARTNILEQLLKQFKNDPVAAILLFLLTAYDNAFQMQLGGYATSINLLTDLINNNMSPLSTGAKQIGSFTEPSDAVNFLQNLQDLSVLINVNPITVNLASTWNSGVDQAIGGIVVNDPNKTGNTITIQQLWQGYKTGSYTTIDSTGAQTVENTPITADQVMTALNSLGSTGTAPPTTGYTTILNAIQQGGQLLTGQSKTTETAAAAVTNLDAQVINVLNAMVSSSKKGGIGFVALNDAIINNFRT